jgi:tripartite-type tricarboxylate transporter receptor subunit TctC
VLSPDIQERITREGATPRPMSPHQFDEMVRAEIISRTRIFKAIGAKPN